MKRRRMGTKRRIMVTLMAVMLLMATSVTAFAGTLNTNLKNDVFGSLCKVNPKRVDGKSEGMDLKGGTVPVYLSMTLECLSPNGSLFCTTPIVKKGVDKVSASKTVTDQLVSAWSDHGRYSKEFTLIVS